MVNCRLKRNKKKFDCRFQRILLLLAGLFLIVEGILSIFVSPLQVPIFQGGRVIRIIIGMYLAYKVSREDLPI